MNIELKIEIKGSTVNLFLTKRIKRKREIIDALEWKDRKNLSEKLLRKIDLLLKKNNLDINNISKTVFYCDSPYFLGKTKNKNWTALEQKNSRRKCGFTAWQIGEITSKTLNFVLRNSQHSPFF